MIRTYTKLKEWYNKQNEVKRREFIQHIIDTCGTSQRTAYRYLTKVPPKQAKETISAFTNINKNELYNAV